jgi:hypothetical protein
VSFSESVKGLQDSYFNQHVFNNPMGGGSHIFLDDDEQSFEPETVVPLSHLCRRDIVVLVA